MNERIAKLKNEASAWCDENIPDQWQESNGYGQSWEDKFAELIVKECIRRATEFGVLESEIREYLEELLG